MDLDYVLYDTAVFTNVANTEQVLFQVAQGGDATHTESFTNMRGSGALPQEEGFSCNRIGVTVDFDTAGEEDYTTVWRGSFLEVRVSDKTVLKAPLALFSAANMYGGHYSQASAANNAVIGLQGDGMKLDIPITIKGGTAFRVRVVQANATSAASKNMKVWLRGTLTTP